MVIPPPSSSRAIQQQPPGEDAAAPPPPARVAPPSVRQVRLTCQFCGKTFEKGLQGHSCPQRRAALGRPVVVDPDTTISVRNWPFQSLAQVPYKDIFCSPLTIGEVPSDLVAKFSAVVGEIVRHILGGEKDAWKAFFLLPRMVFALPRGGKEGRKLASSCLALFCAGEWDALIQRQVSHIGDSKGTVNKQKRAASLARVGYFSGAARALVSGQMADPSQDDVYDKLCQLHPAAAQQRAEPPQHNVCALTEEVFVQTESQILPRRSPDASGWRGDYFKVLSTKTMGDIFKLVERIVRNPKLIPEDLAPYFFGARLSALCKSNGGIRPIAVGTILRKTVSQAYANIIAPQLPGFFLPHQHGVGVPGGAENVVHGLRLLHEVDGESVIVGIDFSNAFDSVERPAIAAAVQANFPQVRTWFDLCYGNPSHLLVKGRDPIPSQRGVQQGDPLGPFFFAVALQPALIKAAAKGCKVFAYLDDVHLIGKPRNVKKAFKTLISEASKIGLTCNREKCWATERIEIRGVSLPTVSNPSVLGVPLRVSEKLPSSLVPSRLLREIASISDLQIALHLLRYVHNTRLTYHFRLSCEEASMEVAQNLMAQTRQALAALLEVEDIPEAAWKQALLPQGPGLGLTDLNSMAPLMASASLLEALSRLATMDPQSFGRLTSTDGWSALKDSPLFPLFSLASTIRSSVEGADTQHAKLQHLFAVRVAAPKALDEFLQSDAVPDTAKAIVKTAYQSPIATQFLHAVPTQKALSLSSPEMRIALKLLLGINLEMASPFCFGCSGQKPLTMYHALSCKFFGGLIHRHNRVKAVLGEICHHAHIEYQLEPKHSLDHGKRPDLVVYFGKDGHDIAYDLTVVSPVRDSTAVKRVLRDEQAFLATDEQTKLNKYRDECARHGQAFCPIVLSAFGGILHASFSMGISPLIHKVRRSQFCSPNWAAPNRTTYWLQRIAVALWAGNAAKVKPFLKEERLPPQ